jgi:putative transposase
LTDRSKRRRERKHLARLPEVFPLRVGEVYLLTACTAHKRRAFADTSCAHAVAETLEAVAGRNGYAVLLYCVMADHVHVIVAAHEGGASLSKLVRTWKTWCTRRLRELGVQGPVWQAEFFDHRIRSEDSLGQKCEYVVHNPVRAGLVKRPEEWPHVGGRWWEEYVSRAQPTENCGECPEVAGPGGPALQR